MRIKSLVYLSLALSVLLTVLTIVYSFKNQNNSSILAYEVQAGNKQLQFYYKDKTGQPFRSIANLKKQLEQDSKTLVFAMNGGMYMEDNRPLGLYIENYKTISKLNTRKGSGNFYLQPNGVFYLDNKAKAHICSTANFAGSNTIRYATQSGPLLVINGTINSVFTKGSANLNIRNGVGIKPDGSLVFAISTVPINFYDFALYFKNQGCNMALYLDGFVSRMYLPEKNWKQVDGNFGVMIAVTG